MSYHKAPDICPVCKEKAEFKFIQDCKNKEGEWSLHECSKCQVQFWIPFKNPGAERYEGYEPYLKEYYNKMDIISRDNCEWMVKGQWNTNQFLKYLPHQNPKDKKLLDLGCGTGEFQVVMENLGYQVYGVDFNKYAVGIAKSYLGLKNIYQEDIFEFLQKQKREEFDVITGFEIFEHLDNPKKFLELIYQALKSDGYLALSFPNQNRYWGKSYDFPYSHLTRWNSQSAVHFIRSNSFEVIVVKKQIPIDYFYEKIKEKIDLIIKTFMKEKTSNLTPAAQVRRKIGVKKFKNIRFFVQSVINCFFYIPALFLFYILRFEGGGLYLLAKKK